MQIVPQFAAFSYCALPCLPMLPAPPAYPLLPAPKIAGLLPAGLLSAGTLPAPRKVVSGEILFDNAPLTVEELEREAGPFLTIEDMDAEIANLLDAFRHNEKWTWTRAETRAQKRSRKEQIQ